jgi:hypothetical protein
MFVKRKAFKLAVIALIPATRLALDCNHGLLVNPIVSWIGIEHLGGDAGAIGYDFSDRSVNGDDQRDGGVSTVGQVSQITSEDAVIIGATWPLAAGS